MNLASLSASYLRARPLNTVLSVLLLALGVGTIVLLLLVVGQAEERMQRDARGIDLVVGAKGSPMQLMLAGIYHLDAPTGNIPLASAQALAKNRFIKKAMPLALGDSWQGRRIVGADKMYAEHYGAELRAGFDDRGRMNHRKNPKRQTSKRQPNPNIGMIPGWLGDARLPGGGRHGVRGRRAHHHGLLRQSL